MRRREFIDIILDSISHNFDIYHNYMYEKHKFVIYAYCYNHHNKYSSVTNEARLWEMKSFEHLFFKNYDNLTMELFEQLKKVAIEKIEPHFVRGDKKYPVKNHFYSYITFIIITRNKPSEEVKRAVESFNFSKKYMFSAKGYTDIRFVCVTPREYSVITTKNAADMYSFLNDILLHIEP